MTEAKSFDNIEEKLYRAVKPKPLYWSSNGHVSTAVFNLRPQELGVSFDRSLGRNEDDCVTFILTNLSGSVIRIKVKDLTNQSFSDNIELQHTPSKSGKNPYHTELIYKTKDKKTLNQIKYALANKAVMVYDSKSAASDP